MAFSWYALTFALLVPYNEKHLVRSGPQSTLRSVQVQHSNVTLLCSFNRPRKNVSRNGTHEPYGSRSTTSKCGLPIDESPFCKNKTFASNYKIYTFFKSQWFRCRFFFISSTEFDEMSFEIIVFIKLDGSSFNMRAERRPLADKASTMHTPGNNSDSGSIVKGSIYYYYYYSCYSYSSCYCFSCIWLVDVYLADCISAQSHTTSRVRSRLKTCTGL